MNPMTLIVPSAARALPEKSKEKALAQLALRQVWHLVFDPCPELAGAFPPDGIALLEPFLEYAALENFSMRWPLHGQILAWLSRHRPEKLSSKLQEELLAACAARWAHSDQTPNKGLLLHFHGMPESGVAAWKSRTAKEGHRIVLVRLPELQSPGDEVFTAALPDYSYAPPIVWTALPR